MWGEILKWGINLLANIYPCKLPKYKSSWKDKLNSWTTKVGVKLTILETSFRFQEDKQLGIGIFTSSWELGLLCTKP